MQYCPRPWKTVEEMNQGLIDSWNSVVKPDDILYFLGDFAFAGTQKIESILKQLNGNIFHILGNHDRKVSNKRWLELGMKEVHEQLILNYCGTKLLLCHFPYLVDVEDDRYRQLRPIDDGTILIHGHRHSVPQEKIRVSSKGTVMYDVGIDAHAKPIRINEVLTDIDNFNIDISSSNVTRVD